MVMLGIFLRGMLMGAADIVPGVSGGTVALLVGVYERFIGALAALGPRTLVDFTRLFRPAESVESREGRNKSQQENVKAFLRNYDLLFLLSLASGIVVAVLLASRVIPELISRYPAESNAFFLGLIATSTLVPIRLMMDVKGSILAPTLFGLVAGWCAYALAGLESLQANESLLVVAASGALAICAMVLPGVSGSHLLKTFGQYEATLRALHDRDVIHLGALMCGMALGLMLFVRVLKWLLAHFPRATLGTLIGFMIGSLRSVWPFINSQGNACAPRAEDLYLCVYVASGALIVLCLVFLEMRNRKHTFKKSSALTTQVAVAKKASDEH